MTLPMKPFLLAILIVMAPISAMADTVSNENAIALGQEGPVDDAAAGADTDALNGTDMIEPEPQPEGLRILDAADIDPDEFLWEWRILAIMADTPNDPAFIRQMREINERPGELFERDVVVIVDTDRNSGSILRQRLRPRGFMLAIIDKDGEVKQRRPAPRDVREISAVIDRFPLRRQEMLERLPAGR